MWYYYLKMCIRFKKNQQQIIDTQKKKIGGNSLFVTEHTNKKQSINDKDSDRKHDEDDFLFWDMIDDN